MKLGERVTREHVIGLIGNNGNSSEPYFHFQLMDRNSPLGSEGLPNALPEYVVRGKGEADIGKIESLAYASDVPSRDSTGE